MSEDARLVQARDHHQAVAAALESAATAREHRDDLVRVLRAEDPEWWSYGRLARGVGCSPELIAKIVAAGRGAT